ncbi:MAG: squalene/phytoene synthase family protein [Gammaproteobacteria bacterium]|nr:squalene/phytoene synthase family protein [Gammaproteobacteria bacterium]
MTQAASAPGHEAAGPADGTLAWYAALFCPPQQRAAIAALHDLAVSLREIGEKLTAELPARMRIGWWGEELGLLAAGQARHPASRALMPHLENAAEANPRIAADITALLSEMLKAVEDDVAGLGCANLDELRHYGYRSRGVELAAVARLFGTPADIATSVAQHAGAAIATSRVVSRLGADLHHAQQRLLVPLDLLEDAGIGEDTPATPATLAPVIGSLTSSCEHDAAQVFAHSRGQGAGLRLARLLVALHLDQCRHAARSHRARVPHQPVHTGSLRRLWVAWREALASKREEI